MSYTQDEPDDDDEIIPFDDTDNSDEYRKMMEGPFDTLEDHLDAVLKSIP
jgi:hypothetical protein